jgi:hypothetical protein
LGRGRINGSNRNNGIKGMRFDPAMRAGDWIPRSSRGMTTVEISLNPTKSTIQRESMDLCILHSMDSLVSIASNASSSFIDSSFP